MLNPSIIRSKFLRNKETENFIFTKIWQATNEMIKMKLLESFKISESEMPIISCYINEEIGWVMTNETLYSKSPLLLKCNFKDINEIDMPTLWTGQISKTELSQIKIHCCGREFDLILESKTWPIIFSLLQFVKGK